MNQNEQIASLRPCPFCGGAPELPRGDGTQYEIECGECGQATASVQICDLMTIEERCSDPFNNYRHEEKYIERAKQEAIKRWNTRTHVNETPESEPVEADVLNKPGNVVFDDDTVWQLAQKVRSDLDRKSCPGVYMDLAMESIVKHAKQALAAEPAPIPDAAKMVRPIGFDGAQTYPEQDWEQANTPNSDGALGEFNPGVDISDAHRTIAKWLNEQVDAPIDRHALAKVLADTCLVYEVAELVGAMEETQRDLTLLLGNIYASAKRDKNWEGMYDVVNGWITRNHRALENYEKGAAVKECVTAQPKKLVRLTNGEINGIAYRTIDTGRVKAEQLNNFAKAIQDAMERKNGGLHDN
jgi:Restriction alleviation protein Lar